jgi:DNA-binding CsgD family transcriptional regulator
VDCPERGLIQVLMARLHLKAGEDTEAMTAASDAMELAHRFSDPELGIFAPLAYAQTMVRQGDPSSALALFDEIMVAVTADDVSPIAVGIAYCAVVDGCRALFDVGRAREWTAALTRWCSEQPDLVPFRGRCLVHRIEVMRLSGAWGDALTEAKTACRWMTQAAMERDPAQPAADLPRFKYPIGSAQYQLAELHRLRGEFPQAEEFYRLASNHGRSPHPGLALLHLAEGRRREAEAALRRLVGQPQAPVTRVGVLSAAVEVLLAMDDTEGARLAAEELGGLAETAGAPYLAASAAEARGRILLRDGDARNALSSLRDAWMGWQDLEAPYEAARVRVLRALACRELGDDATSELELEAAARVFQRLSAAPDLAHVESLRSSSPPALGGKLSPRELEVLGLVATGRTNQAIADDLGISKRTVDRHVGNILLKLGLPSRTAATAYAYENGLV